MDYPYLIFYLLLILLAFLYWKKHDRRIVTFSFIISFVFFAFRAPVVGADTWNYVRYLDGEKDYYLISSRDFEVLFPLYRKIICSITNSRLVVMVINTLLSIIPLYYVTKKYSKNVPLTILMFCYMGCLSLYFVGLRQILALSVILSSFLVCYESKLNIKNKIIITILSVIIGYLMHTTAILYAVFFYAILFIPGGNRTIYCMLIILSALGGFVFQTLNVSDVFDFFLSNSFDISLTERINGYMENDEFYTGVPIYIVARPSFIALVVFALIDKERLSHPFCKIYITGIIIYNIMYSVPMIGRIVPPLIMFGAVVYTWIFETRYYYNVKIRKYANLATIALVMFFLRVEIIRCSSWNKYDEGRMHPYYFFFQDYSNHPSIIYFN